MVEDVSVGLVSIEVLLRLKTSNYSEWFNQLFLNIHFLAYNIFVIQKSIDNFINFCILNVKS